MAADPRPRPGSRCGPLPRVAALALLLVAAPAGAQIYKCTDAAGNILYQNDVACPKNTKAGQVEIFDNSWTADRAEKDAAWQRQAAEHRIVAGMPVRWVREALGEPTEVRRTETAGADEVWLYNLPGRNAQVGVLADQVLWFREAPATAPAARAAVAPDASASQAQPAGLQAPAPTPAQVLHAAPEPTAPGSGQAGRAESDASRPLPEVPATAQAAPKITPSRHGIAPGQDCKQALAELGPPDRQRDVPAFDNASDPTTEYFYEPAGSAGERTRLVCVNGRVEGVDRAISR